MQIGIIIRFQIFVPFSESGFSYQSTWSPLKKKKEGSFQVSSGKNFIFHFHIFPDMLKGIEAAFKVHINSRFSSMRKCLELDDVNGLDISVLIELLSSTIDAAQLCYSKSR